MAELVGKGKFLEARNSVKTRILRSKWILKLCLFFGYLPDAGGRDLGL